MAEPEGKQSARQKIQKVRDDLDFRARELAGKNKALGWAYTIGSTIGFLLLFLLMVIFCIFLIRWLPGIW